MPTTSALMTVEQFRALPEPKEGYYELHHGVAVVMPPPKHRHFFIQHRLVMLLARLAAGRGFLWTEVAFRPAPENECWIADVAFIDQKRYDAIDPEDNLRGAPELVVEVLSASNTASEIADREAMCLENGCREFWVVDPKRKTVRVSTPDRKSITYVEGEKIPLTLPAAADLDVADVFSIL
jgi:Uma2 family endonuclease